MSLSRFVYPDENGDRNTFAHNVSTRVYLVHGPTTAIWTLYAPRRCLRRTQLNSDRAILADNKWTRVGETLKKQYVRALYGGVLFCFISFLEKQKPHVHTCTLVRTQHTCYEITFNARTMYTIRIGCPINETGTFVILFDLEGNCLCAGVRTHNIVLIRVEWNFSHRTTNDTNDIIICYRQYLYVHRDCNV